MAEIRKRVAICFPFLRYEFFIRSYIRFWPYYIKKKEFPIIYLFYQDSFCVGIMPLVIKQGKAELFGNENGFNYCGSLFSEKADIKECITLLKNEVGDISCNKILHDDPLFKSCKDTLCEIKNRNNVRIIFGNYFDDYFKTLSESTRQNIRTAFNRMTKENYTYHLDVYCPRPNNLMGWGGNCLINKHIYSKCLDLYCKRHEDRYNIKTTKMKKWLLLHQHFATNNYLYNPNCITFVLSINDEIAVFMSGITGNDNQLVVPRLSISNDFRFYSPGMILLHEAIRYLVENTSIRILDLSQGEEEYKFKMGGEIHQTMSFVL